MTRREVEGEVVLRLSIDEEGAVEEVVVVFESHPLFGRNARRTALEWRFVPMRCDGEPAGFMLTLPIEFRLNT